MIKRLLGVAYLVDSSVTQKVQAMSTKINAAGIRPSNQVNLLRLLPLSGIFVCILVNLKSDLSDDRGGYALLAAGSIVLGLSCYYGPAIWPWVLPWPTYTRLRPTR